MDEIGYTICSDEEMKLYNSMYKRDIIKNGIIAAIGYALLGAEALLFKEENWLEITAGIGTVVMFGYGFLRSHFLMSDHDNVLSENVTYMYNYGKFSKERGRQKRRGGK